MADLVRTIDGDGEEEASADEDGPVLASKGLAFGDLGSEDDDEDAPGWDFEAHHATEEAAPGEQTTGLAAKIRARLVEKAEEQLAESGGASGGVVEGGRATSKSKPSAGRKTKVVKKEGAMKLENSATGPAVSDHLNTGIHFSELRLSRPLLRALSDLRFESPTPIQRDVIPAALRGLDVLATAETGSGKTASFLLPALERLCQSANVRARRRDAGGRVLAGHVATKALVLIPTRELAVQCHAMLRDLAKYTLVTSQLVAGGFVSQDQANSLRQQPDIVVATPGRMLDHLLNTQSVHMELLEIVVFDEADRLLELGFRNECLQVLECCSKGRQTMLFSATLNSSVEDLAKLALVKPVRVSASPINRVTQTLEQEFVKAPSDALREAVLLSLCTRSYCSRAIVFCATRQAAHRLAIIFGFCGLNFAEIHGNLPQGDRVQGLQRFQRGDADFLLATDLAARGLDLLNVETVINFHLPLDVSRYIHRVGRTARMGKTGRAVTIYTPEEYAKVKRLGRQCCGKVQSKVLKRTVASDSVEQWAAKIGNLKEDIEAIVQEESLERELRLADLLAGKSDNLQKHKQSIQARPAKQWYITNTEKRNLKVEDAARVKDVEASDSVDAQKRRSQAVEDPQEVAEAKRRKRTRERFHERKETEKAERDQTDRRIRAAARRSRKAGKTGKGRTPKS